VKPAEIAWLHDEPAANAPLLPLDVALSGSDHAWSYVFLASGRSRGITGRVTHLDGGIGVKL
jgi:enoyl-[acyl-carrier-protein] reductase (NADH)